jgi:CubicO group peptidase (beta-lactamase class C family)
MTKSISSIAIGQYLCEGLIGSLNDRAEKYSKSLQGTAYGDATIQELLMMASTGSLAVSQGQPEKNFNQDLMITHKRSLREAFVEFGRNHKNPASRGSFSYKGLDTVALSIILADIKHTKYQNVISQNIWTKIGAEKNAEIVVDKNNDALAQSGFGATPRDWARLGIYVRDNTKSNSCFGSYLREATTGQINNYSDHGPTFMKYGYQFWTNNKFITTKSAWFNGYGGQLIGIDLESGKIIVLLSYELGAVLPVYKLFDEWTR